MNCRESGGQVFDSYQNKQLSLLGKFGESGGQVFDSYQNKQLSLLGKFVDLCV